MLENKEFKIEKSSNSPYANGLDIINQRYPWRAWWFDKDQLNALINILTQLKEVRNESSNNI